MDLKGILTRAYACRNEGSRAFFICDGGTQVGMGLYCEYPELESYELNQFFIDARYQGRGYTRAAKLILDELTRAGKYRSAALWRVEGNETAKRLSGHIGFSQMGWIRDEIGMNRAVNRQRRH